MSSKGALTLLADYGGDSSDEEVPGTRASTKRTHRDDSDEPHAKRLEKLPVPTFMLSTINEPSEDPTLHEGRLRSFPHERGNWATYVYIPFEQNEGLEKFLYMTINSLPPEIELKPIEDLHVSLTRTFVLKYLWIDPFISTVKEIIPDFTKFIIMFSSLNIYCNEERSRTFLGLQIKSGFDSLLKLIECLDNCLKDFKLPPFYKDPSFHMSIAWCLGDCEEKLKSFLPELNQHLQNIINETSEENWYICVDKILCKTGNKIFQFHLP